MSDMIYLKTKITLINRDREIEHGDEEYCQECGNGDKVPEGEYFVCPECDAEWNDAN